ncbi:hypothetical protein PHMEG_00026940 [Phytophthora megakarya]|uniref:Uncharacterized protein n=1 Tax=Phytophthora megakarya TaxID=4795 RepID=A0A225V757_9STRA|nr:hypothetical protein PHMEG_00026940 [Phytophthora megakarya]
MELLDDLRSSTNFFFNVADLREFITSSEPAAGMNPTIKLCCNASERLSADNGTCVTLVNSMADDLFDEGQETLTELNTINRKPFIARGLSGMLGGRLAPLESCVSTFASAPCMSSAKYTTSAIFRHRQGQRAAGRSASDRIKEIHPPALKRKREHAPSHRGAQTSSCPPTQ